MKKDNINIDLKFIIFILYNITYVAHMLEFIPRFVNLVILAFFIIICFGEYSYKRKGMILKKDDLFFSEFISAMIVVLVFFIVSVLVQVCNMDFNFYIITELLYNVIPPVLTFFWINSTEKKSCYKYFLVFFLRNILYFVLANRDNFTIANITGISWSDSKSSVFELVLAHDFLFLELILLYFKKEKLAICSLFLCLLCFKRLSFICAFLVLIVYYIFKLVKKRKKHLKILDIEIPKFIVIGLALVFSIAPVVLQWMVSDEGIQFFKEMGINLNKFSTGRVGVINYVVNNIEYFNGYGSSDYFMEHSTKGSFARLGSMHCDTLKLFYEVTEIGVIVFFYEMLKISKKNIIVFIMMLYILLEVTISHFLDQLSVWNMFFMFTAYIYSYSTNESESDFVEKKRKLFKLTFK